MASQADEIKKRRVACRTRSLATPTLHAGAIAIATVLAVVVDAGPFGFDMGDSMPDGETMEDPGIKGAPPYVEIERPLDKWTTIWVYGDDRDGVTSVKGSRRGSHVAVTCREVAEIYGEPELPDLPRLGKFGCSAGLDVLAIWTFEPPEENDVVGIFLSFSKDRNTTTLHFFFESHKGFIERRKRDLREGDEGADSLY